MVFVTTPLLEAPYVVEYVLLYGALLWVILVTVNIFQTEVRGIERHPATGG